VITVKRYLVGTILGCPNKFLALLTCVVNNILKMPHAAEAANFGWLLQANIIVGNITLQPV